jgi:catechol 2,3-dioxygenase
MSIAAPVLHPPFNVVRALYVDLGVSELARARAFWVDALGYVVTEDTGDVLFLRGLEEQNHHSLVLRASTGAVVHAIGFRVLEDADLDRATAFCVARRLPHRFVSRHAQGRTLEMIDPLGVRLELTAEVTRVPRLLQQYGAYRGARPQRIDHVNCFVPDVQAGCDFYRDLGFRVSEYTETDDTGDLWAVWMHRKGNVHDLALTSGVGPRLHHLGVWVSSINDIINVCDLLATSGWLASMERGPGRHGISNAFFLYLRDPDGHRVELFTSDYLTADPDFEPIRWDLRDPQRQTLWGAPAPASWFEEGSVFAGVTPRAPRLEARPLVAPR